MGKIAIVGCEASGKTVFMSALADHYRPDAGGRPCLVPENSEANRFTEFGRRQMRALRQWPPATNPGKTVEMQWSLRENGRVVSRIGMLEFGGETFRAAFRGDDEPDQQRAAVTSLLSYLADSDSVILLISIKELLRNPAGRSVEEFERDTESIWVSRGLLEFVRRRLPDAAVVIGLTQADRYRDELQQYGGAGGLLAAKWPTIGAIVGSFPVVEVASVSATDADGQPAPDYTTDGIEPIMSEVFRQNRSHRGKGRRTLLLTLLLLAAGGYYASTKFDLVSPFLPATGDSHTVSKPTFCSEPTNAVTAVTESTDKAAAATGTTDAAAAVTEPPGPASPREIFASRLASAEAGDVKCLRWLGHQYYGGTGVVTQNLAEARRLYTKAAEGGDARAQVCLAVMCEKGEGGPRSPAEAMDWYRRAAENGVADAQYRMGIHAWENRDADTGALAEAKSWFDRARISGCRISNLDSWINRVAAELEKLRQSPHGTD